MISVMRGKTTRAKLDQSGRVVIPAAYRKALGLKPGDRLIFVLEGAIARAQKMVRRYVPRERRLSEELMKEHMEEASRG